MNSAIELHDSKIEAMRMSGGDLHLVFSSAYVHRSAGRPGIDAGSGHVEPAEMVFAGASFSESGGTCIGPVSDGSLSVENGKFENFIPLPLGLSGRVSATIAFSSGSVLAVTATGVSYQATGPARFVEAYEG
jgi:hypothetical protein